jgi:hypothetical protein
MLTLIPDVGDVLELPVVTSFKRSRESLITDYPAESRATLSDGAIGMPETLSISGFVDGERLRAGWADALSALHGRALIAQVPEGTWAQIFLKSSEVSKTPGDGDGAQVTLALKQILVSEAKVLVIKQTVGTRTGPPKDKQAPPKPAEEEESDAYDSLMSRASGFGEFWGP